MRKGTDPRALFGADPRGDELLDESLRVKHAERRVFRVRNGARLLHDTLQDRGSLELRGERHPGDVERLHLGAALLEGLR